VALEPGSRGTLETTTMPALEIDSFIRYLKAMKEGKRSRQG